MIRNIVSYKIYMVKRLLNCSASDFQKMSKDELLLAIKSSEGRCVLSENIAPAPSFDPKITNSELARAFGADLILLNGIDLFNIKISGLPDTNTPIDLLKRLVGRPIGVNIEPIDLNANMFVNKNSISKGRTSCIETFKMANNLGFDFICLTGNPETGVTNKEIINSIKLAKKYFKGIIIAGKMHSSGVNEEILNEDIINKFIKSGADIILVPACGTIPGITLEKIHNLVNFIHSKNKLVLSAIGTSQESSSKECIRNIALMNKMAGVDIQHIGDGSHNNIAPYQNIFELSITIRGERHTLNMIARSNLR